MKQLRKKIIPYLPLIFIIGALLLRAYKPSSYPFAFDQVQIAKEAGKIAQGDFTLIGPRTGPAPMFTGPLIYYISAAFALVFPPHYAVVAAALTMSLATGISLYFLSKRYLNESWAITALTLWAFSPLIIGLERIPWNPNLTILASSLVFFPLLKRKQLTWFDLGLIFLGNFLGYQAHFSGLLLPPLTLIGILARYKKDHIITKFWTLIAAGLGLVVSLTPTILFDYMNNWLNWRGLETLLTNKNQIGTPLIWPRLIHKSQIVLETLGKLFFDGSPLPLLLSLGVLVFVWNIYRITKSSKKSSSTLISLSWIITVVAFFSLYRHSTPEYYFLILLPVLLYLLTSFIDKTLPKKFKSSAILIFIFYSTYSTYWRYHHPGSLSLGTQLKTHSYLQETTQNQAISHITYDMENVNTLGFRYLNERNPLKFDPSGKELHLVYPYTSQNFVTKQIESELVVWIDSRTKPNRKYLKTDQYLLEHPQSWQIYLVPSSSEKQGAQEMYAIYNNESQNKLGHVWVFEKDQNLDTYRQLEEIKQVEQAQNKKDHKKTSPWKKTALLGQKMHYKLYRKLVFVTNTDQFQQLDILVD